MRYNSSMRYVTHFCGLGGACHGLEQAGLSCALAIDNDGDGPCIETRAKSLRCDKGIKMDIRRYFDANATGIDAAGNYVFAKSEDHRKDIFLLWTSPPCKKFSFANDGPKDDLMENLYRESLKFVEWAKPKYVVMENVKGIIKYEAQANVVGKEGKISKIAQDFRNLGYRIEWNVLNATRFGCAQTRERVIFVASSDPSKTGLIPRIEDPKWIHFSSIRERGKCDECLGGDSYRTMNEKLTRLIRKHRAFRIRIIGLDRDKGTRDDFMPTVTCGFGGGITRKKCAVVDRIRTKGKTVTFLRHPTLLEGVRAQGFPDDWIKNLPENASLAWNMVGNAVPSPISKAIAEHLIKVDRGEHPPSMPPYNMPQPPKEVAWE